VREWEPVESSDPSVIEVKNKALMARKYGDAMVTFVDDEGEKYQVSMTVC
jgi:hypothetical protein